MRPLRLIAAVLLGFVPVTSEAQTKDPLKGAALLAEARRALGGDERLSSVRALDVRGDFKRLAGQNTIEGQLQIRLELPGKLRRDEDLSLPGGGPAIVRSEVLNGATVWDENSGGIGRFGRGGFGGGVRGGQRGGEPPPGGRAAIDPAQLEELQRRARQTELARFALIWLLQVEGEVAWVGTAEAPDGRADVLEVAVANAPVLRLFLDSESHIPLMITWEGATPQLVIAGRRGGRAPADGAPGPAGNGRGRGGAPATLQITLGDYKVVNGIRLPHLITRGANDMTLEEWTIESYRVNPTFRADVFTR